MDEIIATHTVKPSSPTPLHLKTHTLSFIDQIMPPVYTPLIFFYQKGEPTEISRRLKQSLSQVLTIFYPFAGTIRENSHVDCDDSGAAMVEARIHAPLQHFTKDPDVEELQRLFPTDSFRHKDKQQLVLVKASYFDCGGVSVGVCLSHKIGDAASLYVFMDAWAATCRGDQIIPPSFDMALHLPPMDAALHPFSPLISTKVKITMKRLVFEREKLEKLKKEASSKLKDPTTVEAVSGFIWKAAIEAYKAKSGRVRATSFVGSQAVNIRPRAVPPIPEHTMGNGIALGLAVVSWEEDERERGFGVHASRFRDAVTGINGDYINRVIKECKKFTPEAEEEEGRVQNCLITSWRRFPMYEVDFGWGKPLWVTTSTSQYTNTATLMSTPSGDGIEAWVSASPDNHNFIQLLQAKYNNL